MIDLNRMLLALGDRPIPGEGTAVDEAERSLARGACFAEDRDALTRALLDDVGDEAVRAFEAAFLPEQEVKQATLEQGTGSVCTANASRKVFISYSAASDDRAMRAVLRAERLVSCFDVALIGSPSHGFSWDAPAWSDLTPLIAERVTRAQQRSLRNHDCHKLVLYIDDVLTSKNWMNCGVWSDVFCENTMTSPVQEPRTYGGGVLFAHTADRDVGGINVSLRMRAAHSTPDRPDVFEHGGTSFWRRHRLEPDLLIFLWLPAAHVESRLLLPKSSGIHASGPEAPVVVAGQDVWDVQHQKFDPREKLLLHLWQRAFVRARLEHPAWRLLPCVERSQDRPEESRIRSATLDAGTVLASLRSGCLPVPHCQAGPTDAHASPARDAPVDHDTASPVDVGDPGAVGLRIVVDRIGRVHIAQG